MIPQEFQEEFSIISIFDYSNLKKISIYLNYEGKVYKGYLSKDPKGRIKIGIDSNELKNIIKEAFIKSNRLIKIEREKSMAKRKAVVLADKDAEFIEFYRTDVEDTYEIKFVFQCEWTN